MGKASLVGLLSPSSQELNGRGDLFRSSVRTVFFFFFLFFFFSLMSCLFFNRVAVRWYWYWVPIP